MMVDSETVISQVEKFKVILHEIHAEGDVTERKFLSSYDDWKTSTFLERFQELSQAQAKGNEPERFDYAALN